MKADIITIGDEILIGQVIDTNGSYLATRLNELGIETRSIRSISDQHLSITEALDDAIKNTDLVLITGGLGPTNDDITKKTLHKYFGGEMHLDPKAFETISKYYEKRGIPMVRRNHRQAEVPDTCTTLENRSGSAPGMLFRRSDTLIVSMPGVPYEMKDIFENELVPLLQRECQLPVRLKRTILTTGIPESVAAERLSQWEAEMPANMRLAYLPSPGRVRLRVSISGSDKDQLIKKLNDEVDRIVDLVGNEHVYGYDDETLEGTVGRLLKAHGLTLAVAESCTGGNIARLITSVSGASEYFPGGVISYANSVKTSLLKVDERDIEEQGAVSKPVVLQMARGVRDLIQSDFGIATSGIAGPTGGSIDKPVGTVWIAIAKPDGAIAKKFVYGNNRERNITMSSYTALNMLRLTLLKHVENYEVKS